MNKRWLCAGLGLALVSLDQRALSDDTCECADMADLMNREAEERAAIKAYRDALAQWGNSPPAATEAARRAFQQGTVQPAVNQASLSGTNKATGETDAACHTTIDESTACMKEVAAQHEHVHAGTCHVQPSATPNPYGGRHATLADYAREEIAAYEAEAAFVHGSLVNLQANCQLQIEFESQIRGTIEATDSKAKAKLDASISTPDHQPSMTYRGTGTLDYETKDVGPPKVVGDPMLVELAAPLVCYGASEGKGSTSLDVVDGELWRSNVPPYEPRLTLTFDVGATDETYTIKGKRQCRQKPIKKSFWSDLFVLGKTQTAANQVLIDDWAFNPRPGVYAEKVIQSTCGASAQLPGPFAAYGPVGACNEATTIVVRLRKR